MSLMKGPLFWVIGAVIVAMMVAFHVSDHGDGIIDPIANVHLLLDENATLEHCYEGRQISCPRERTGYSVRGGTLRTSVSIFDLGIEDGVHRATAVVDVDFDVDQHYDGFGWSRLERPILYGAIRPARAIGEGMHRHMETYGDVTPLHPLPPPDRYGPYAPIVSGACSTDTSHDLCRFRAAVPITGETTHLLIHLRERFR